MTNQITVTATIPEESKKSSIEFWSYINRHIEQDGEAGNINQIDFEYRLKDRFGHNLKKQINTYFHDSWYGNKSLALNSLETLVLASFFFEVFDIHLTSNIEFKINIVGIEKIVELFGKNLELFKAIFRSYIPSAFMTTTMMTNISLKWEFDFAIKAFSDQIKKDKNELIYKKARVGIKRLVNIPFTFSLILAVCIAWVWNQSIAYNFEQIKKYGEDAYDINNLESNWRKKWLDEEKERLDRDKDRLNNIIKKVVEEKTQPIPSKTSTPQKSEN